MSLPQRIECDHCGYVNEEQTAKMANVGDEQAWLCPACNLCNTSYHLEIGFRTTLGYQRNLEVGYL